MANQKARERERSAMRRAIRSQISRETRELREWVNRLSVQLRALADKTDKFDGAIGSAISRANSFTSDAARGLSDRLVKIEASAISTGAAEHQFAELREKLASLDITNLLKDFRVALQSHDNRLSALETKPRIWTDEEFSRELTRRLVHGIFVGAAERADQIAAGLTE